MTESAEWLGIAPFRGGAAENAIPRPFPASDVRITLVIDNARCADCDSSRQQGRVNDSAHDVRLLN
jgi:hypothetical protein